jgi:hypothetical protein
VSSYFIDEVFSSTAFIYTEIEALVIADVFERSVLAAVFYSVIIASAGVENCCLLGLPQIIVYPGRDTVHAGTLIIFGEDR